MFEYLHKGQLYSRNTIAELLGYKKYHAIARGVVTPASSNCIFLFVTKEKQTSFTQYNDYIDSGLLYWEGASRHSSDQRIINADRKDERIILFYRHRHHTDFIYFGEIYLLRHILRKDKPSEFIFSLTKPEEIELPAFYQAIDQRSSEYLNLRETDREQIAKARIGQSNFRSELIKIWGKCSVTGVENLELLSASHIKPWKESDNTERLSPMNGLLLNPALDKAFDRGLLSFNSDGKILISPNLTRQDAEKMAIHERLQLRKLLPGNQLFLEYHRNQKLNKETY